jgi:hypothetical protein
MAPAIAQRVGALGDTATVSFKPHHENREGNAMSIRPFPGDVPERFIGGAEERRTPAEGDNGIVYAPWEQAGL